MTEIESLRAEVADLRERVRRLEAYAAPRMPFAPTWGQGGTTGDCGCSGGHCSWRSNCRLFATVRA